MATTRTKSAKNEPAKLLAALSSVDPKARRRAAGALGNLGDAAAVAPLAAQLAYERDLKVIEALIGAIGRFATPAAAAALVDVLRRERGRAALLWAAANALGALGEVGVGPAAACLGEGPPTAVYAARALGFSGSPAAVPPLVALRVGTGPLALREAAVEALGSIEHDAATDALIAALGDVHPDVQHAAAKALVRQGARAAPAVAPLLRAGDELARRAAYVFSFVKAPAEAAPDLIPLLLRRETAIHATMALAAIDGGFDLAAEALPAVGAALDGADPGRCYAAAWTLSQLARRRPERVDDGVIAALTRGLALPEYEARSRVAEALAALSPRGVDGVIARLDDEAPLARQGAAAALAQAAAVDPRAAPALARLLGDEGCAVWAAEALARIGRPAREAVGEAAARGGETAVRARRLLALWP
jgi:HEAT repeat protein